MKITDWIRSLWNKKPKETTKQDFQWASDDDNVREYKALEYLVWYNGDSDLLNEFYTSEKQAEAVLKNRKSFFWAIATEEQMVKKVHSGVPNAIISTLVNVTGDHKLNFDDKLLEKTIDEIYKESDFISIINQEQLPLTLAQGWGALKLNVRDGDKVPTIEFYPADRVEFIYDRKKITAIIYKNFYEFNKKKYLLLETRGVRDKSSYIEYKLFKATTRNEVMQCPLNEIPEFADLEDLIIPNYNKILGVASKIFHDPLNPHYGRSVLTGKVDLFDELDQVLSQRSQTIKVSTPVEYYPNDIIGRGKFGELYKPKAYNRQYIQAPATTIDGDGNFGGDGKIQTTQPQLNLTQYNEVFVDLINAILIGVLSPATMGFDISKKDNAEAQREKEKVTISTRNNIIAKQQNIIREATEIAIDLTEYLQTGKITLGKKYGFTVEYDKFATPTFEQRVETLGGLLDQGGISEEKFVNELWQNDSDEEKAEEVARLKEKAARDNFSQWELDDDSTASDID